MPAPNDCTCGCPDHPSWCPASGSMSVAYAAMREQEAAEKKAPEGGGAPSTDSLPFHRRIDALADRVTVLERTVRKLEGLRELDAAAIESHERRLAKLEWRRTLHEGNSVVVGHMDMATGKVMPTEAGEALMEGADTLTGRDILRVQAEPTLMVKAIDEKISNAIVDKHSESLRPARPRRWWRLWS